MVQRKGAAEMTSSTPVDPMAFFREMLGQWEKAVNESGNRITGSEQFAQLMGQGTTVSAQMQSAINEAMGRALAVANMPSKADIDALSARIAAMEKTLARIEGSMAGAGAGRSDGPSVSRNRKPPGKQG